MRDIEMGRHKKRLSQHVLVGRRTCSPTCPKGHKEAGAETEDTRADRATETEIEPVAESRQNKTRHNKQTGRLTL